MLPGLTSPAVHMVGQYESSAGGRSATGMDSIDLNQGRSPGHFGHVYSLSRAPRSHGIVKADRNTLPITPPSLPWPELIRTGCSLRFSADRNPDFRAAAEVHAGFRAMAAVSSVPSRACHCPTFSTHGCSCRTPAAETATHLEAPGSCGIADSKNRHATLPLLSGRFFQVSQKSPPRSRFWGCWVAVLFGCVWYAHVC